MTATTDPQQTEAGAPSAEPRPSGGRRSTLGRYLLGIVVVYFGTVPLFWWMEEHAGVSHGVATNSMTVLHILCFAGALALPWLPLPGRADHSRSQRFDAMVIIWIFIALAPRFIWELPWLFFLDQIKEGVLNGELWSYLWSPYLLGGDARYLNGDPLIVSLEWIAVFVGAFELYAIVQFFRQGRRFSLPQLAFIMGGMIVEVTLPAVYFLTDILGTTESAAGTADLWIKFVLLNSFWCTLPLLTFGWGVRRLWNRDLTVATF